MDRLGGSAPMPATYSTAVITADRRRSAVQRLLARLIICSCLLWRASIGRFMVLGLTPCSRRHLWRTSSRFLVRCSSGRPSGGLARSAGGRDRVPQVVLAALCAILGVLPQLPLRLVSSAVTAAVPGGLPAPGGVLGGSLGLAITVDGTTVAGWAPLVVLAVAIVLSALVFGLQRLGGATVREVPVWNCGEEHDSGVVRYAASSFYLPFKQAIAGITRGFSVRPPAFRRSGPGVDGSASRWRADG
jgi:hypothetical protein